MCWQATALRAQKCDRADVWLQVRNTQGQEGGFCKVELRLKAFPDNPIQCVASACQFKEGSGKIQCKDAQCACGQGTCPGACSSLALPVYWQRIRACGAFNDLAELADITACCLLCLRVRLKMRRAALISTRCCRQGVEGLHEAHDRCMMVWLPL